MVACVIAFGAPVRAQDGMPSRAARLEYKTTAGCPDLKGFRDELVLLNQDRFDELSDDVMRVTLSKPPGGLYRATVEYEPKAGRFTTKTFTSPRCDTALLRDVINAALAGLPPRTPEPPPAPSVSAPEPVKVELPAPPLFVPPPVPRQRLEVVAPTEKTLWQQLMDLSIGFNAMMLLTAAFSANVGSAAAIGVDVRGEIFSFGVDLRGVFPAQAYAREIVKPGPGATPATLDVSQFSVLFVPCARWKYIVGCGVAEIGGLFWQSPDRIDGHGDTFTYAFGPRIGVDIPLAERLSVIGIGEVLFPPKRFGWATTAHDQNGKETGTVGWRQSPASVFFGVGLSVKIK